MNMITYGSGTENDPWVLKTPSHTSEYEVWKDEAATPAALVVQVGKTRLSYQLRCIEDLAAMLRDHGDWMPLGTADEGKPVKEGTVEAWARDDANPVGGFYGLRKGYRGRFASYVSPVLERLGRVEFEKRGRSVWVKAI